MTSVKQLRKCASHTVIQVLQRGAEAEDMGEGSVLGRPHWILLGYNCNLGNILVPILWIRNLKFSEVKKLVRGFPGGAVVENLPANAGDTGSSPGLGRSHMPRSIWAREPQLLSLRVWSLCSATREAAIVRGPHTAMKSGPRLPQLEKALAQKRRPNTAIKINK